VTDEGELIAGRYRLVSRVGRGSMGVVWRAWDERLDRVVALKQLLLEAGADEEAAQEANLRAMREARVAARLRHPHAIIVHDVVVHGGKPCLVLEFLPSQSLTGLLTEHGSLPPKVVARVGSQVASALAMAHAEGIVHRDVTPGNVLITEDGTAKIADFGISRATGEGTVTASGFIVGTPAYLAPEVAGGMDSDFPSDVFSLGATLYTALEGKPPFGTNENPIALLQHIAHAEINQPKHEGPLADVLRHLLRRDPAERPPMTEVQEALAAVADGRPIPKPPPPVNPTRLMPASTAAPAPTRPRRRWIVASLIAVCLLAAGVAVGALVNRGQVTDLAAPAVTDTPSLRPQVTMTTAPTTTRDRAGCVARYQVTNSWPGGYQVLVTVSNDELSSLSGWAVSWALPQGHSINNLWNGTLSQQGSSVTVTNADWNAKLRANGSTTFGLIALTRGDSPARPTITCQTP
jgi:Protein kinase domain/Cellulose binding domain